MFRALRKKFSSFKIKAKISFYLLFSDIKTRLKLLKWMIKTDSFHKIQITNAQLLWTHAFAKTVSALRVAKNKYNTDFYEFFQSNWEEREVEEKPLSFGYNNRDSLKIQTKYFSSASKSVLRYVYLEHWSHTTVQQFVDDNRNIAQTSHLALIFTLRFKLNKNFWWLLENIRD